MDKAEQDCEIATWAVHRKWSGTKFYGESFCVEAKTSEGAMAAVIETVEEGGQRPLVDGEMVILRSEVGNALHVFTVKRSSVYFERVS